MKDVYQQNGFKNRTEYLESVADDYGVDILIVRGLAGVLGPEEDFDGLISFLEDYGY